MTSTLLRIGLFGIGRDAYWPQFAGPKETLEGYVASVARKLSRPGVVGLGHLAAKIEKLGWLLGVEVIQVV